VKEIAHYFGTPIWGNKGEVLTHAVRGSGAFVSYVRPDQMKLILEVAGAVAGDNGAFSAWRRGIEINWTDFYLWLMKYYWHEKFKFFIIPDVILGTEADNNLLINSVPSMFREKATPVWHLHESLDKLDWLCGDFKRVALGATGEFASIRSPAWRGRMEQAFDLISRRNHKTKPHGLRMMDNRVVKDWPFATMDSTNLARNVPKYKVKYPNMGGHILERVPFTQEDKHELLMYRCACLKGATEKVRPPTLEGYNLRRRTEIVRQLTSRA
jgi:hypothetical protein